VKATWIVAKLTDATRRSGGAIATAR
jgi:hypothetical protein